jgi:hypothetical protein
MLTLLCHKGNEKENHIMIPPHSIRIVTIKDTNNLKWWRCGENWTFMQCWWECKLVQSLWKKSMRSLLKPKNRTALWYNNSTPRDILQGMWINYNKGTCRSMFIATVFTRHNIWKQPRSPTTVTGLRKCETYLEYNFIQL